jgi:pimeloyl-ACP methyl ester carboxylesterase
VIIGTSRGGLLAMALALTRAGLIAGSVLNDIGPRIAVRGLLRLRAQLGTASLPDSWQQAAADLKSTMGHQFPAFGDTDWDDFARRTYREVNGKPALDFDPRILEGLAAFTSQSAAPDVTAPFKALVQKPALLLRGGYSDLLDEETLAEAVAMGATPHTVEGQGHAPALQGGVLDVIEAFLADNQL